MSFENLFDYTAIQYEIVLSVFTLTAAVFAAVLSTSFDRVVERARALGYQRIVWMTLRSDPTHVSSGNRGSHYSFAERNALQCGYCTPGMILSAVAFLKSNHNPTEQEIAQAMEGNICRCGTYPRIVAAIQRAARKRAES